MRISKLVEKKTGKTRINIIETVKKDTGKWTTRVVTTLGYLDELNAAHGDGLTYAKAEAARLTEQKKLAKAACTVTYDPDEIVNLRKEKSWDRKKNFGYHAFLFYYRLLGLDKKLYSYKASTKVQFNPNDIFSMLVMNRIIAPASKAGAWANRRQFFESTEYSLDDVYRFLTLIYGKSDNLIQHINRRVDAYTGRSTTLLYYDVTNYYFEIINEDELRKKGVSKEHRPNPIVQMGLFMDAEGLPITFKTYSGNTNDVSTFIESIKELKKTHLCDVRHAIFVGDKAMMSGQNVAQLRIHHAGYVISDSVRKAKQDFLSTYVLNEEHYNEQVDSAGVLQFKYKEVYLPVAKHFKNAQGENAHGTVNERIVIFWSRKYQQRARHDRQDAIQKALRLAQHPKTLLSTQKGAARHTKVTAKEISSDEDAEVTYEVSLDLDRIKAEEQLDGYYIIRSNVIGLSEGEEPMNCEAQYQNDGFLKVNRTMTALDIVDIYRGLWKIEGSFRITKSELNTRPVFVYTEKHIQAHFLICFVALLLIRVLERDMGGAHTVPAMLESLRKADYAELPNGHFFSLYYDKVLQDIGKRLNLPFNYKYLSPAMIRNLKGAMNKEIKKQLNVRM